MKVSYYPGCSLEGTARDYEESIQAICKDLEIELEELPDWNCCGATAAHSLNHQAAISLSGRNLVIAEKMAQDMVVPCPLCFNRLKTAEKALLGDDRGQFQYTFRGSIKIWDMANFISQSEILNRIKSRIKKPLKGLKVVCYYGCMSSRPPKITDAEDCENPVSMDRILKTLGAEVIPWSYKTDCCGASHVIARPDLVFKLVGKLYQKADQVGADCFVVSCQMCQANLDMYQEKIAREINKDVYFPIFYFTELIGLALDNPGVKTWLSRHFVDPMRLLSEKELT